MDTKGSGNKSYFPRLRDCVAVESTRCVLSVQCGFLFCFLCFVYFVSLFLQILVIPLLLEFNLKQSKKNGGGGSMEMEGGSR